MKRTFSYTMSLRESLINFESQMVGLTLLQDQETKNKRPYKMGCDEQEQDV
jgi:hypothetical protein